MRLLIRMRHRIARSARQGEFSLVRPGEIP